MMRRVVPLMLMCCLMIPFIVGCGGAPDRGAQDEARIGTAVGWFEAVQDSRRQDALRAARELCGELPAQKISDNLSQLCRANGVSPLFLKAGFNGFDMKRWQSSLFFRHTAAIITRDIPDANAEAIMAALFSAVDDRLRSDRAPEGVLPWPAAIWREKAGLCDRQAWVLCELAYQLGFDTQIVYLLNPETKESPHTICEIRKGDGVWVADPYSGKLLPGTSVAQLADDEDFQEEVWPGKEDWHQAIRHAAFWLPAYPEDYCVRNQLLQGELRELLGDQALRFGEPPRARMKRYLGYLSESDKVFAYNFWFYPFRLLAADMRRSAAGQRSE